MDVATTLHFATCCGVEQRARQAQHVRCNRSTLVVVRVQQGRRRAHEYRRQFPAQIVRILHAGIEALTTGRGMNMRRVSDKEHAVVAIPISQACVHVVGRSPRNCTNLNVRQTGAFPDQVMQSCGRQVDFAFERNRRLDLEQRRTGQWAQGELARHVAFIETMPCIARQSAQHDVCHQRPDAECLARKRNAEQLAHRAAAAHSCVKDASEIARWRHFDCGLWHSLMLAEPVIRYKTRRPSQN